MPSTYSTSLKLELIGNGEQAGAWGTTTNNNLGTLLEQAITGVLTLPLYGTDVTLTNYNGLSDQARNAVIILTGNLTSACNVIAPAGQQKTYIVRNRANAAVTIKTSSGNGITISNAASEVIFTDGTDFYSATQFNYINGDLTVTGNVSVGGTVTIGGDVYGNVNSGQWYIPTGNTAARSANGTNGLFRYNTEIQAYEGYSNNTWVRFLVVNEGAYTINYVSVGGGGGALDIGSSGFWNSGGGGGGKMVSSTTPAIPGTTVLTITVGAGGAAGTQGGSSTINGVVDAIGGFANPQPGGNNPTGGTSGNGYSGGAGANGDGGSGQAGGGGGGAGDVGGNGSQPTEGYWTGGNGGGGLETLITGTSQVLAGGGGGGAYALGGTGANGGGNGSGGTYGGGTNGSVNTGGGAGGVYSNGGHAGGSGVVFLSMPTLNYTGVFTGSPTVLTSGSNTILKFTGSGSYTA